MVVSVASQLQGAPAWDRVVMLDKSSWLAAKRRAFREVASAGDVVVGDEGVDEVKALVVDPPQRATDHSRPSCRG